MSETVNKRRRLRYKTNSRLRKRILQRQAVYRHLNGDEIRAKLRAISRRPADRFDRAKREAKRRGLSFSLSLETFKILISRKCVYCGSTELCQTGSGLDRVDNKQGYAKSNVVSCCTVCNSVKNTHFTHDEMLILGKTIAKIRLKRHEQRKHQFRL